MYFLNSLTVLSIKCFSCHGNLSANCENTTTEIDCPPSALRVYDSCYTMTKISDYFLIGRRVEQIKGCSVLAHCGFLKSMLCNNKDGFIKNCSVECCTGNLCNNETFKRTQSSIMHVNFSSTITQTRFSSVIDSHVTITQAPSSSINRIFKTSNMSISWISTKSQVVVFSSAHAQPSTKVVTTKVKAICAGTDSIFIHLPFVLLMVVLSSGVIIFERL